MFAITLTTDRKIDDFFLGRVKGQILKDCPGTPIVDLAHNIGAFNVSSAGFIIKNSFKHFPENTIHLIGVDSERGANQKHLIIKYKKQYFIGADNGVFSLIFDDEMPDTIVKVNDWFYGKKGVPALFTFVNIARNIIEGKSLTELGEIIQNFKRKIPLQPSYDADFIIGRIIYIDSYNNVVTNITRNMFDTVGKGRRFKIFAGSTGNVIKRINKTYQETANGEILALFNSMDLLEIASNKGKIAQLLSFSNSTNIRVDFFDNEISDHDIVDVGIH